MDVNHLPNCGLATCHNPKFRRPHVLVPTRGTVLPRNWRNAFRTVAPTTVAWALPFVSIRPPLWQQVFRWTLKEAFVWTSRCSSPSRSAPSTPSRTEMQKIRG